MPEAAGMSVTAVMPAKEGIPEKIGIEATLPSHNRVVYKSRGSSMGRHVWKSTEVGDTPGRPSTTENPVTAGLSAAEGRQKQQESQKCHI